MQQPTIGRIVIYRDQLVPGQAPVLLPAVIQRVLVGYDHVDLYVFGPGNTAGLRTYVAQGDGPGRWNWPALVEVPAPLPKAIAKK